MQTVIGLFKNATAAQEAKQQLLSNGFSEENIDVSTSEEDYATDESYLKEPESINVYQDNASSDLSMNASTTGTLKYPGAAAESTTPNESLSTSKDESFGTKVSNFFGSLFGTDDNEAEKYSKATTKNGNLITVHVQSTEDANRAADILDDCGAIDVNEDETEMGYATTIDEPTEEDASFKDGSTADPIYGSETGTSYDGDTRLRNSGASFAGTDDSAYGIETGESIDGDTRFRNSGTSFSSTGNGTHGTITSNDLADDSNKLNVIKEEVNIGKKEVETGGVRLRSRIVERPVEEQLRLREEKIRVVRTPVDRPATTSDFQNFKEGVIEMTEHTEVAEVTKQARIVEEIKLSKEVNERTQNVSETARDTEVEIEEIEPTNFSAAKTDQ